MQIATARPRPLSSPHGRKGLLILMLAGQAGLGQAQASCPSPYNDAGDDCSVSSTDVCVTDPSDASAFLCDLATGGGSGNGTIYAVYNSSIGGTNLCASGADYCVFGTTSSGADFCCELTASYKNELEIQGSAQKDYIYLTYSTRNLTNHTVINFTGEVWGNNGNDEIYGSNSSSAEYTDELHGGAGTDTIHGNAGDDLIWGDTQADYRLEGGYGDDVIYGGDGPDAILGGPGEDTLYGEDDDDWIGGGDDADDIEGGNDDDVVCGDDGTDTLYGNAGNDQVWGGDDADTVNGGLGLYTDNCGDSSDTKSGCESPDLTSEPGECPE